MVCDLAPWRVKCSVLRAVSSCSGSGASRRSVGSELSLRRSFIAPSIPQTYRAEVATPAPGKAPLSMQSGGFRAHQMSRLPSRESGSEARREGGRSACGTTRKHLPKHLPTAENSELLRASPGTDCALSGAELDAWRVTHNPWDAGSSPARPIAEP